MPSQPFDTAAGHKQVWLLAGPLILSNISVPLVGIVDTAVVGRLGNADAIGAIALGGLIFSFLYWGLGFLRMGTTGLIARAVGANDAAEIRHTLLRALLLALCLAGVILLLHGPIIRFALFCLQADSSIESQTRVYASIRIFSAPATLCLYVFTGLFIGRHQAGLALLLQLILNLTNIVLDLVFVVGLGFAVAGVAWASLIAEYLAAAVGFFLLRRPLRTALDTDWRPIFDRRALLEMMRSNRHLFVRTLCLIFSFACFTALGARYGATILAANAILMHFMTMAAYALDGFAHAAEALAGSAYGAQNRRHFIGNVKITSQWALASGLAITLIYALFGGSMLHLFTDLPEVLDTARRYLPWVIAAPLVSVASYQLDGIYIGSGQTGRMQNAMLASTGLYLLGLYLLLPWFDNHGLYLSLMLFMLLRAATLLYYFPRILHRLP